MVSTLHSLSRSRCAAHFVHPLLTRLVFFSTDDFRKIQKRDLVPNSRVCCAWLYRIRDDDESRWFAWAGRGLGLDQHQYLLRRPFWAHTPQSRGQSLFVLPVQASIFAWGTGLITGLLFLAAPSLGSAQHFGSWLGLMGWWYGMGPGSKARKLKGKARKIEKDLSRFTVLDGGQSDSNRDDWVN